jgi:hypothetical protein
MSSNNCISLISNLKLDIIDCKMLQIGIYNYFNLSNKMNHIVDDAQFLYIVTMSQCHIFHKSRFFCDNFRVIFVTMSQCNKCNNVTV